MKLTLIILSNSNNTCSIHISDYFFKFYYLFRICTNFIGPTHGHPMCSERAYVIFARNFEARASASTAQSDIRDSGAADTVQLTLRNENKLKQFSKNSTLFITKFRFERAHYFIATEREK